MRANSHDTGSMGRWEGDNLRATALLHSGVGADAGLPESVRFLGGVAKLICRRIAQAEGASDPKRLAVFLLAPSPLLQGSEHKPKRTPMLDNGLTPLTGRLWFVSAVVVSGRYLELKNESDDELFSLVSEGLTLGDRPAIVFDPRVGSLSLRFYPRGLAEADSCTVIDIGQDISVDRVFFAIDGIYENCLITPDAQSLDGKTWVNAGKYWPSEKAERIVQMYLRVGLVAAFPVCTIRHEQPMVSGRNDLEIEQSDSVDRSRVVRHAVLELKVLRSFSYTGKHISGQENKENVEDGVNQAGVYRKDKGFRAAALCCFDMRQEPTGEECFEHVREKATQLDVRLRNWFLFSSSEKYREFCTSKPPDG